MINITSEIITTSLQKSDLSRIASDLEGKKRRLHRDLGTKSALHNYYRAQELREALSETDDAKQATDDALQIARGAPEVSNRLAEKIRWFRSAPQGPVRGGHRSEAKNLLFHLWREGRIILPIDFSFHKTIDLNARTTLGTELLKFISTYVASDEDIFEHGNQVEYRVTQHSLSWIYSTNWHVVSNIPLDEVIILWDFLVELHKSPTGQTTPPSVGIVIAILARKGELGFSDGELNAALEERIFKTNEKRVETRYGIASSFPYIRGGRRNAEFFCLPEHLSGTEWEFPRPDVDLWNSLFKRYIDYRVVEKGFESTKVVKRSLYCFADYIGFFLPQFCYDLRRDLPLVKCPKHFKRYPFVDQAGKPLYFPTFMDFLRDRSSKPENIRANIQHMEAFFDWVSYAYGDSEFEHIAGPSFTNPVSVEFNVPRSKRRNGTDKTPFSAEAMPHLLSWLYAVEEFGTKLTELDPVRANLSGRLKLNKYNENFILRTCEFGELPSYECMGETYQLKCVPQVLLVGQKDASKGLNLSGLRMIMAALETGLRLQTFQWLDRYTWSRYNRNATGSDPVLQLYLNTDKTKAEAWETPILRRVYDLLVRQQNELDRLKVKPRRFAYEGREHSRFDPVAPLFVNSSHRIISDTAYDTLWTEILSAFTGFAFENDLGIKPMIAFQKDPKFKVDDDPGQPNVNGFPYCKLAIKREHTPHSCRSTFVTRRSGALGHVVLAELVGHSEPVTTAHYDFAEREAIFDALKVGEETIQDPISARSRSATIRTGPASIKARSANSALQRSFAAHRDETIERFGMISLSSALSDADETGISVLRHSSAADIIFRDTHICPVGEECPKDVVEAAGARMRCGVCKLACKSVDHLPAICAKIRALRARIKHSSNLLDL